MIIKEEAYLEHYGILRRSGRYPWNSGGKDQSQHDVNTGYLSYIDGLKKNGLSEKEIAQGIGVPTTQLRAAKTIATAEVKQANISMAQRMHDRGNANTAIATRMGISEAAVRTWLAPGASARADALFETSNMLKKQVAEKRFIDVGAGVDSQLNISKEKLAAAVHILKEKGYAEHIVKIPQATTSNLTTYKILCPPGTTWGEVRSNMDQVKQIIVTSPDGGHTYTKEHPAMSIHPDRVGINYKENGGDKEDGVIYVRPGVKDVSLGNSRYAQVRIQVGDGHYLKGMAIYKADLPKGTDLLFNTNKSHKEFPNKLDVMKPLSTDKDLPFGAITKPLLENQGSTDPAHPEKVSSVMNIVNEQGTWTEWSKTSASQFLAKQSPVLAKKQLAITVANRQKELDEIKSLTNPAVKKKLLQAFADGADASSVNLDAAAISASRQSWHVILPIKSMSPTEVYAPQFRNGERVALVRFPHGGTFEIPELTVNNNQPEAKRMLGDSVDAVGIHHTVAERLSGADFDGDTVVVIPNNSGVVKSTKALEGLKNFSTKDAYPPYEGMVRMTPKQKGFQMGMVSNLITDMTVKAAPPEDVVRAIKHSMVVIDAEKHNLNWKLSEQENGIPSLKLKYQGKAGGGASTLLSRARSPLFVDDRKDRLAENGGPIDKVTGQKMYRPSGKVKTTRDGKVVPVKTQSVKLAETTDAHTLSSGTLIEKIYADHSNALKAIANEARLEMVHTPNLKYSESAKKAYASEVSSLNVKLHLAKENRPRERQAQLIANSVIKAKKLANPNMDSSQLKKIKNQAINDARNRCLAKKSDSQVEITQKEWNAIQAGAISNHLLTEILTNADLDAIRKLATPHASVGMTSSDKARARQLISSGYTRAEVADKLGIGLTTLNTELKGVE